MRRAAGVMPKPIRRKDVESQARAYLESVRFNRAILRSDNLDDHRVTDVVFEKLVQQEVELTLRQLRAVGRIVP